MENDLKQAIDIMRKGGVILYPTDTIWGLGCDASNSEAVKRIYEIKHRSDSKSMILLVSDIAMLERTVGELPETAEQLIEVAVNPLTIIYPHAHGVVDDVVAADGSVGVRITSERFSRELCRRMRGPIVSTSANMSGAPAPRLFNDISHEIINAVDYVVNYRQDDLSEHMASNIIKINQDNSIIIIR